MDDLNDILDGLEETGPGTQSSQEFFGSYQLIEKIGIGGTAQVFRARHVHPQYAERDFALKILHEGLLQHSAVRSLFRNEGYFLSQLSHPNIVHTHEAGIEAEHPFVAMEFVDGVNLRTILQKLEKAGETLSRPLALHIMHEVLAGLAFAHRLTDADREPIRLVHRDINPGNVFASYDGAIKLGDFGVAVLAGQDVPAELAAGTPGHFAPEQLDVGPLEQSADVYACGILMYGLLCGRWPYEDTDNESVMEANQRGKFPKPRKVVPDLERELEDIILRAMHKKPRKRYPDAKSMLVDFEQRVPAQVGMPLVVRALLRSTFATEYQRALTMRAGLAGELGQRRGAVTILGSLPATHQAIAATLSQRGVTIDTNERPPSTDTPRVLLVDTREAGIDADAIARTQTAGNMTPVVLLAHSFNSDSISLAHRLHATDILIGPVDPDRLYTAVWAALFTAERAPAPAAGADDDTASTRVLLVSGDHDLAGRLCDGLREGGYDVTAVASTDEAIAHLEHASPRLAIFDLPADTKGGATFAQRVRAAPGIGLLPILYLCAPSREREVASVPRCAALDRRDPVVTLKFALDQLNADVRHGRAFSRFVVSLPAEMTYGGRAYSATATDISRGGAMLSCTGMPPVGADASMTLRLGSDELRMRGHILRVAPGEGDTVAVGVRISSMRPDMERRLIKHLRELEAQATGAS